jgi:hypothetical protein
LWWMDRTYPKARASRSGYAMEGDAREKILCYSAAEVWS